MRCMNCNWFYGKICCHNVIVFGVYIISLYNLSMRKMKEKSIMNDNKKDKYDIMKSVFSLSMLDKFPCGIIVIRRKSNYKIVYFNQFLKNLLGIPKVMPKGLFPKIIFYNLYQFQKGWKLKRKSVR